MTPKAAEDLPFPGPVLSSTMDGATGMSDTVGSPGGRVDLEQSEDGLALLVWRVRVPVVLIVRARKR